MEMRRRGFLIGAVAGACAAVGGEAEDARERVPPAVIAPPGSDGGKRLRFVQSLCVGNWGEAGDRRSQRFRSP